MNYKININVSSRPTIAVIVVVVVLSSFSTVLSCINWFLVRSRPASLSSIHQTKDVLFVALLKIICSAQFKY